MPELFIAKDEVDTNFICMLYEIIDNNPNYFATAISPKRISKFVKGEIELRTIITEPEITEWYNFEINANGIFASKIEFDKIPEKHLPDKGFFLNDEIIDNSLITEEVFQKNNAVVHLAVSDEFDDFGADTDDLADIFKLYSVILENCFKKGVEEHKIKGKSKKGVIIPMNYKLRAFNSSRASFNVHLYSKSQKDLFGNCIIEFGLEKIDQILSEYKTEDELITKLRSVKGHTINSFTKLLKKIIDEKLKIKHKWFSPNQKSIHYHTLDFNKAEKLYAILNKTEGLTEEIREFVGVFVQADVERGTWRIKSSDDGKEYSGQAIPDELKGITLDTVKYKLSCQEIIEEYSVTEKEKTKYIFKSVESLT